MKNGDERSQGGNTDNYDYTGNDPAAGSDRVNVAITDGGNGNQCPPQGIRKSVDMGIGTVFEMVETGGAGDEDNGDDGGNVHQIGMAGIFPGSFHENFQPDSQADDAEDDQSLKQTDGRNGGKKIKPMMTEEMFFVGGVAVVEEVVNKESQRNEPIGNY